MAICGCGLSRWRMLPMRAGRNWTAPNAFSAIVLFVANPMMCTLPPTVSRSRMRSNAGTKGMWCSVATHVMTSNCRPYKSEVVRKSPAINCTFGAPSNLLRARAMAFTSGSIPTAVCASGAIWLRSCPSPHPTSITELCGPGMVATISL